VAAVLVIKFLVGKPVASGARAKTPGGKTLRGHVAASSRDLPSKIPVLDFFA